MKLNTSLVKKISSSKSEPDWMLEYRLKGLEEYLARPVPTWGPELNIEESKIEYYVDAHIQKSKDWKGVPESYQKIYNELKIPEAEKKFLAGVEAQYDSNVIYGKLKAKWESRGVIFTNMEEGVQKYPELVKKWFGKVIPYNDNKYAALNSACWSGGSFVYVPKGVKVDIPLQAFFYIQNPHLGQFERTLIIADEDSDVTYVEGCTAPQYSTQVLHSGVIELIALKNARIRYTTIQNWSKNIYNLVTQRGLALENATIEWVDCNIGSQVTMKYPCVILGGKGAHGEVISLAVADNQQIIDSGAKMIHKAPHTSSIIQTKSISKNGGRTSYRGKVDIQKGAVYSKSKVTCDALILDDQSQTDTYPTNIQNEKFAQIEHEARVSKLSEKQVYYLMSKGLSESEASALIVSGFLEPITKELPLEYAMEMNQLLQMSMEGSVG